jgi:xylulokinase
LNKCLNTLIIFSDRIEANSMSLYIGIDLGTSGLKAVLVSPDGAIAGIGFGNYPIDIPRPGYAEQDPLLWYKVLCQAVKDAMAQAQADPKNVLGIGISGHMHGTILLDKDGELLYPSVLWCDQRTGNEKAEVIDKIGIQQLGRWVQNNVNAGFQSLTLLWFRNHMPDLFAKMRHVLLPGDYLRYRLTGEISTERTGAASTLLYDNSRFCWNADLLNALDLPSNILPCEHHSPVEIAGRLTIKAAADTGLAAGTPVAFGGGDQPMGMLGNGLLHPGDASVTLGTAGQVCVPTHVLRYDEQLRTNTFAFVPDNTWYVMGATLNACLAYNWFLEKILNIHDFQLMDAEADKVSAGCHGMLFLPYLTGERTPHQDERARAGFYNIDLSHGRSEMVRAVMEGVAFSLLDALYVMKDMGLTTNQLIISGGGAVSRVWRQIIADVFNHPLRMTANHEQAGLGAAICAMVACGEYDDVYEACGHIVTYENNEVVPNTRNRAVYEDAFERFRETFKTGRQLMHRSLSMK